MLDLKNYVIVYANEEIAIDVNKARAERVRALIAEKCGCELEMRPDDAERAEYEILLGSADRDEIRECGVGLMCYRIRVTEKKIVLASGGAFSLARAIDALEALLERGLEIGYDSGAVELLTEPFEERHGEYRVMQYNILVEYEGWGSGGILESDVMARREPITALIFGYDPDMLVLCEFYDTWRAKMPPALEHIYEFVCLDRDDGVSNRNGVAFRRDMFELIDCGYDDIGFRNDINRRAVVWAVIKDKRNGKQFILCGTHFDWAGLDRARIAQIEWAGEAIDRVRAKHKGTVILTGDLNIGKGTAIYNSITPQTGGLVNAFEHVEHNTIDHMFVDSTVTPTFAIVEQEKYTKYSSDHKPIVCDMNVEQ